MAINLSRKKVIIIVVALLVLIGGGVGTAYVLMMGQQDQKSESTAESTTTTTTRNAYQQKLDKAQAEVTALVAAGDEQSIEKANQIIDAEVQTARASGDMAYVVEASNAKASLLVETDRPQEALDLLLALEQEYDGDDEAKYQLYAAISYAYKELDNQAKADEYLDKIPGGGWD